MKRPWKRLPLISVVLFWTLAAMFVWVGISAKNMTSSTTAQETIPGPEPAPVPNPDMMQAHPQQHQLMTRNEGYTGEPAPNPDGMGLLTDGGTMTGEPGTNPDGTGDIFQKNKKRDEGYRGGEPAPNPDGMSLRSDGGSDPDVHPTHD